MQILSMRQPCFLQVGIYTEVHCRAVLGQSSELVDVGPGVCCTETELHSNKLVAPDGRQYPEKIPSLECH